MKERLKWIVIGSGLMIAAQSVTLLAIHYLIPQSGPEQFLVLIANLSYTLVAFLAGGFIIGRLAGRRLIIEPTLAVVAAVLLDILVARAGLLKGAFVFGTALEYGDLGTALATGIIGILAAVAGAFAGERLTMPVEDRVSQALVVAGLVGLSFGPYILVSSQLPPAFALIIGLILLASIAMAAYRFNTSRQDMTEISIRPESHLAGVRS